MSRNPYVVPSFINSPFEVANNLYYQPFHIWTTPSGLTPGEWRFERAVSNLKLAFNYMSNRCLSRSQDLYELPSIALEFIIVCVVKDKKYAKALTIFEVADLFENRQIEERAYHEKKHLSFFEADPEGSNVTNVVEMVKP